MKLANARYKDAEHTTVLVEVDGELHEVPVDLKNTEFVALIAQGVPIAPAPPPKPTRQDVRNEASRRLQHLVGARDEMELSAIIIKNFSEAIQLAGKDAGDRGPAESARMAELACMDQTLNAIQSASAAMQDDPPLDFADDARWPPVRQSGDTEPRPVKAQPGAHGRSRDAA